MIQLNPWNAALVCLFFLPYSRAEAAQWPVHGGPVNQAVPQYRASYPLYDSEPKDTDVKNSMSQKNRLEQELETIPARPSEQLQPTPGSTPAQLPSPERGPEFEQGNGSIDNQRQSGSGLQAPRLAKKTEKKKKLNPPAVDYSIYRDRNPLPIDPRKPCGICTNPIRPDGCGCSCGPLVDAPGLHGKPFQESEPGGCTCGKKKCGKCKPMFSVYWPRSFSAKLDEHFPQKAAARYSPCQKKRIVDVFDKFVDFKLIDYQRKDNGYCGEDSDPYGCLGETRMVASGVAGVGYRFPSVPVDRTGSEKSFWY